MALSDRVWPGRRVAACVVTWLVTGTVHKSGLGNREQCWRAGPGDRLPDVARWNGRISIFRPQTIDARRRG